MEGGVAATRFGFSPATSSTCGAPHALSSVRHGRFSRTPSARSREGNRREHRASLSDPIPLVSAFAEGNQTTESRSLRAFHGEDPRVHSCAQAEICVVPKLDGGAPFRNVVFTRKRMRMNGPLATFCPRRGIVLAPLCARFAVLTALVLPQNSNPCL